MKIRCYQNKNEYFIYWTFYKNLIVGTKQKSRPGTKHKKDKMDENIIENHQTKIANRNTRGENGDIEQSENKRQNGSHNSSYANSHPKCK